MNPIVDIPSTTQNMATTSATVIAVTSATVYMAITSAKAFHMP